MGSWSKAMINVFRRRRRVSGSAPELLALRLALAFDEPHRERQHAIAILDRVDRDDVGVRKRRSRPCLAKKALSQRRIASEVRWQHLERDQSIEAKITREVDRPHATASELALDGVAVAKLLPDVGQVAGVRHYG